MPPRNLRSSKRTTVKVEDSGEEEEENSRVGSTVRTTEGATEEYLATIQGSLNKLVQQMKALRERNAGLEAELEAANTLAQDRSRRGGTSNDARTIRELEEQVRRLTADNIKQKQRIKKFEKQELEHELKELQPIAEDDDEDGLVVDVAAKMKKLLRRFADLMVAPTISTGDECTICMNALLPIKCSVLKCQHIVCNDCLPGISRGADETVRCPECRKDTDREDVGIVHFTNEMWWDEMTKVAQAWGAIDRDRTEMETSEEEDEENMINDESTENSSSELSSDKGQGPAVETDDDERPSTPPRATRLNLRPSASPEKRKRNERLEELAARKRSRGK